MGLILEKLDGRSDVKLALDRWTLSYAESEVSYDESEESYDESEESYAELKESFAELKESYAEYEERTKWSSLGCGDSVLMLCECDADHQSARACLAQDEHSGLHP